MDIEERMAKAETDIAVQKETQRALLQGQADLRADFADLRAAMEKGFAEQRAALAEERAERQREFRWMFSALLAVLALVLGIVARLAGVL